MVRLHAVPVLLLLLALLSGCESMSGGAGASGQMGVLTSLVTQQLGVSEAQANGGIGAMLKLAQERLSAGQFDQVAQAIPGADKYLATAKQLLGGTNVGDTAGLQSAFAKLGVSSRAEATNVILDPSAAGLGILTIPTR